MKNYYAYKHYYAYKPRADGSAPMGTSDQTLFKLKTDRGARRRARRVLGETARVFRYRNFYDDSTFKEITL